MTRGAPNRANFTAKDSRELENFAGEANCYSNNACINSGFSGQIADTHWYHRVEEEETVQGQLESRQSDAGR
jgi:hypothetical protein